MDDEAAKAKKDLIRVLELDDDMSWDDIVAYAAKAKSTGRMANAAVRRRTEMLAAAIGCTTDNYPELIRRVTLMRVGGHSDQNCGEGHDPLKISCEAAAEINRLRAELRAKG